MKELPPLPKAGALATAYDKETIDEKVTYLMGVFSKILGAGQDKLVKHYAKQVDAINAMESAIKQMSSDEIGGELQGIRRKIEAGDAPDKHINRVFALGREIVYRNTGKRAYDVQLIGALALNDGHIAEMATGQGKACPVDTPVPTPDGWRTVGDIKVGDYLFGPDGSPTQVLGVYPQGEKEIYELTLKDGRTIECADEHLWSVYTTSHVQASAETLSTQEMFEQGARCEQGHRFYLPMPEAVEYSHKNLPLEPYIVGAMLEDNCENADDSDPQDIKIPIEYRTASIDQRWALVQGLMDSNGDILTEEENNRYGMRFFTPSENLRDDFMEVLYSLGISCNWHSLDKTESETVKRNQYCIEIDAPRNLVPNFFRLAQKKDIAQVVATSAPNKDHYDRIAVTDIKKTRRFAEQVCFTVAHPTHLFLVGEYIVTHNTITTNFAILMNALAGNQVHVVTVNEYLSGRDAELCQEALVGTGVSVGYIYNQQPKPSKIQAYACDVVYGTPSEFGFDYLRDNMVTNAEDKVQPHHDYAIIDEIDSILIDEARTPLIISGAGSKNVDIYKAFAISVRLLIRNLHYEMDEAKKTISATEAGLAAVEKALGIDDLYSAEYNGQLPRYLKQALSAQFLYHKDKDYIVSDGEVKIVDPNTGRIMEGRRWSEGLHQAIEAKEGVEIQQENDTLATVTLQNFFRLYDKLSGCTGTAMTEDAEFRKTYDMGVVAVPTAQPVIRQDMPDVVYKTVDAKFTAIADKIVELNAKGQPVLVGTVSVENSEKLSHLLAKRGIKHFTLNAKNHEKEAHIVAQAGRAGAVTIATNMAGRGTDIILGGNADEMMESYKAAVIAQRPKDPITGEVDDYIPQAELDEAARQIKEICKKEQEIVLAAGGLAVIGSERHESRRIDNQLRGRSGRQGDPGYSQFYISLEDDLMRLFGQDRMDAIKSFMDKGGLEDDMPLDAPMISKAIERAQHQVESMHYEARKHTLDYDDVLNKQRLAIYSERDMLLDGGDIASKLKTIEEDVATDLAYEYCSPSAPTDDWEWDKLSAAYGYLMGVPAEEVELGIRNAAGIDTTEDVREMLLGGIKRSWSEKEAMLGEDGMSSIARQVLLTSVDNAWKDHLNYMDYLKSGIGMRSYGQRDPLTEYKDEAYKAFEFMVDTMYQSALTSIMRIAIVNAPNTPVMPVSDNVITANSPLVAETSNVAVPGSKRPPTGSMPIQQAQQTPQTAQQQPVQPMRPAFNEEGGVNAVVEEDSPFKAAGGMGSAASEENAGLGEPELIE